MVAAGFAESCRGYDVEKAQGKVVKPFLYEILVEGTRCGLDVGDFQSLARVVREPHQEFRDSSILIVLLRMMREKPDVPSWDEVMFEHRHGFRRTIAEDDSQ